MEKFTLLRAAISQPLFFITGKAKITLLTAFILFETYASLNAQSINLTGPAGSGQFGVSVTILTNGNYVITDPTYDNGAIIDVGAVYLYNGTTHALISTLTGSTASDQVGSSGVIALSNGNYVVRSPLWDNGAVVNAGAVTWCNGTTGLSGVVSSSNSLVGSTTNDQIGNSITELSNANYVVVSTAWDNGVTGNVGAVTWGNGTTGISGVISSSNSLVGSRTNDQIGDLGITTLSNGNYVVRSFFWDNGVIGDVGAVTWGNGVSGTSGVISSSNSLVGSTAGDQIGNVVVALSNGNYVVRSTNWDRGAVTDAGAVTWGNGTSGISGFISSINSLVGSMATDQIGNTITALSNGNYVVTSFIWDNGASADAGAVTWGNGTTGISGVISSSNSLVGSTASDNLGGGGITTLSNGNYVVSSPFWDNGAITDAGAVTWGNGVTGTTGVVSSSNSLVGSKASDQVGSIGIIALSNSNYLVHSPFWDNGVLTNAGAVTWGNGISGITGAVSSSNSLVGSTANDNVGFINVAPLSNGHYVVIAPNWDNGATANVGAVTWGNGSTGRTGTLTSGNSLVGSTANDQVGNLGVTALSNGNYVVKSSNWDNGAVTNVGAATWGNGTSGITGVVSSSNSLVGSTASDGVSNAGVVALSNGNYVVGSNLWDNGVVINTGAVTWGNGTTGTTGVVSSSNSLVGSTASDQIGTGITALTNGNYVVRSVNWDNGAAANAGAATWGNGATGTSGLLSSSNSLVGSTANDNIGTAITALSNGNYLVRSTVWDNGAATNAGAVTWGNGASGTVGIVSSSNSLVGSTLGDGVGIITVLSNGNYVVRSNNWDNGATADAGAITWGNGSAGVTGTINTCNSVIGTAASGGANMNFVYNTVYPNLIVGRLADNIVTVFNPSTMALANSLDAVTVNMNGTNAVPLIASGACRLIASLTPNGGATAINGTVNAKVWIEPSVPTFNVLPFVARHFEITPVTNPTTATSNVTLYFTQQEFDDFNADPGSFWDLPANAGDATGKANLRVARYPGISSNGSGLPGSYTPGAVVIDPVDTDIIWNSTLSRWEVSFDVAGFGGFILQTSVYPLAVHLNFNGQLQNNNGLLNWQTSNEVNIRSFILERSTDASNYAPVYNTAAFNTAGNHQYHFTDSRIDALHVAVVYYRLKQVDADGRFTYSNIVALSPAGKNMVLLYPNPVQDKASLLITVNKAQQLQYSIMDNTGRIITTQKRNLVSGSNTVPIDVSSLPNGMYWIGLRGETLLERKPFVKR